MNRLRFHVFFTLFMRGQKQNTWNQCWGKTRNAGVIVLLWNYSSLPCLVQPWQCGFMPEWSCPEGARGVLSFLRWWNHLWPSRFVGLCVKNVYFNQRWIATKHRVSSAFPNQNYLYLETTSPHSEILNASFSHNLQDEVLLYGLRKFCFLS